LLETLVAGWTTLSTLEMVIFCILETAASIDKMLTHITAANVSKKLAEGLSLLRHDVIKVGLTKYGGTPERNADELLHPA